MELIQIYPVITRIEADVDARIEPHEEWALETIRGERTRKLSESDWRVLPDSPVENKAAWVQYRQALRDLPELVVAQNFVDIPWPVEPLDS